MGSVDALLEAEPLVMTPAERLEHLDRLRVARARLAAAEECALAAASDPDDEKNWDREEIACVLRWSFGYTQARIVQAHKLVEALPEVLAALEAGDINPEHARAAAEACYGLDLVQAGKVEARVLPRAAGQTVTEFRRALTRAVHTVDALGVEARHQRAKKDERGVWQRPLPDGMAGIWSVHTAVDADAILTRIGAVAAVPTAAQDTRSADERRADALANLVLGVPCPELATAHGRKPTVHLLVPLEVALGHSELPGELVGYGPIPASLCRTALTDPSASIRRLVLSPLGQLVDCSATYVPSRALADRVILRDRTCRMPGCNRKAYACELDHAVQFTGTNTVEANLHCLCRRHHHAKHDAGWQVRRRDNGVTEWISPRGRKYAKPLDPWPRSTAESDPDPPP
jgi:hypothetical protein